MSSLAFDTPDTPMTTPRRLRLAALGLALTLALAPLHGCGTLLFPQRRGQGSGDVDPNIVLLDALGLVVFIVPGLVSFVVDFATGAIYLPPGVERGEGPFFRDDGGMGIDTGSS